MRQIGFEMRMMADRFVLFVLALFSLVSLSLGEVVEVSLVVHGGDLEFLKERAGEKKLVRGLVRVGGGETFGCGVRVHGATGATQSWKKSYRLKFRKAFGQGKFQGKVFESGKVVEFDEFLLRNPAHDSWTIEQETWRENARYVNEQWCRETMALLGHVVPRQRWVRLTLNGEFEGIYLLSEMPDQHFASATFGGTDGGYVVVRSGEVKSGAGVGYERFLRLLKSPRLKGEAGMKMVERYLEVGRFIDYFLVQMYAVNADWPRKNYAVIGGAGKEVGFRFMVWDSETCFWERWENVRNEKKLNALEWNRFADSEWRGDSRGPGFVFRELMKLEVFRERFRKRALEVLGEEGVLSPEKAAGRYRVLLDEVEPLLVEEGKKWGKVLAKDGGEGYGVETERWRALMGEGSWLFREFFPKRSEDLLEDLRVGGYF